VEWKRGLIYAFAALKVFSFMTSFTVRSQDIRYTPAERSEGWSVKRLR
jgi:hypothetical protein